LVSGSLIVFLVHSTTGIGAPDKGIWILIGSPARTLIFLPIRPSKYSFGFSVRHNLFSMRSYYQNYTKFLFTNYIHFSQERGSTIPLIGLAVIADDVSLGFPWPAALMAVTRYSY
jgi:hypothetical protein